MVRIIDLMPSAVMPDPEAESDAPGIALQPPDDDDLIRPGAEEELFRVGDRGTLAGRGNAPLAKHLLWTFGPVHRALPFALQLRVELDGDRVITVDPEVGWLHQGLEKACEQVPWSRVAAVVGRARPLHPVGFELATSLALERLHGVAAEVGPRAQLWRVIALELSRIDEHLAVLRRLVPHYLSTATTTAFVDAKRATSGLLDGLLEGGTFRTPGGLARTIHSDEAVRIGKDLPRALAPVLDVVAALEQTPGLDAPLHGVGRIERRQAQALCLTGPALRACGVADDVRFAEPCFAYDKLSLNIVVEESGCARARGRVRMREVASSLRLVDAAIALLLDAPDVPVLKLPSAPPAGMTTVSLELGSGELSMLVVSDGSNKPMRVRLKPPSLQLVGALPALLVDGHLDDVVPAIHSLGMSGTELDR